MKTKRNGIKLTKWARSLTCSCPRCGAGSLDLYPVTNYGTNKGEVQCLKCQCRFYPEELPKAGMKQGDTVTIYSMPLSEQGPEGKAKLLRMVSAEPVSHIETWDVEFVSDGLLATRDILRHQSEIKKEK